MNYIGVSNSQLKGIDTNTDRQLDKQILNHTHSQTHTHQTPQKGDYFDSLFSGKVPRDTQRQNPN